MSMYITHDKNGKGDHHCHKDKPEPCPQLPGTLLRVFIPAGAVLNLLGLFELTSPSGICLVVRIPLFQNNSGPNLNSIIDTIRQAGGTVEIVTE